MQGHTDTPFCLPQPDQDEEIVAGADEKIVRMLVAHDPSVVMAISSWNGDTALHMAERRGRVSIVKCLVEGKADVNVRNRSGLIARQVGQLNLSRIENKS